MHGKHARLPLLALTLAASAFRISNAQHEAAAIDPDSGCSDEKGSAAFKGDESPGLLQAAFNWLPSLPPIAFLKTHKTGGSTMTNIVHRLVNQRHLNLVFPNEDQELDWRTLAQTVPPQHQFDVVCNHNIFNETSLRAYLKPSPFIFSILREPVSATNSRLGWKHEEYVTWPSRLEYMSERRSAFANPFARDLGWYGVDTRDVEALTPPELDWNSSAIAAFVERMDRVLDLVVLTEHYDEGLVLLRRKLGLSMEEVTYLRMKVNDDGPAVPEPTPEQRSRVLTEFLPVDTALYEHFHSRFWRDWEAAGGEAVLQGELAELRLRNSQLEEACAANSQELCPIEFTLDNGAFTQRLRDTAIAEGRLSW